MFNLLSKKDKHSLSIFKGKCFSSDKLDHINVGTRTQMLCACMCVLKINYITKVWICVQ